MSDTNYENLNIDRGDSVVRVTIDSIADRNAIWLGLANELIDVAVTFGNESGVRCIVLTHEGDFFGVGADLSKLDGSEGDEATLRRLAGRLHEAVIQFHQAETPVVGGVDGVAAGASFSLALLPDVLLLSDESRLEYGYPRVGLTGDGGSTFFLPRLVGLRAAKEIALFNEPIDPERAVELGLATEVVDAAEFDSRLTEVADRLASGPTAAFGTTKRLMTESFDTALETQLSAETEGIAEATQTEDFRRGLKAFFSEGDPDFVGE